LVASLNGVVEFVQPSGQGETISDWLKAGPSPGVCPLTEARRGVQQQWPSSMQQTIAQTSGEALARPIGA
jgi:hypothetical protein